MIKRRARFIVVTRHAEPTISPAPEGITEKGEAETRSVAKKLRARIPQNLLVRVKCSDMARGRLSAKIIAEEFGTQAEEDPLLSRAINTPYLGPTMDLAEEADTVIVVGHLELTGDWSGLPGQYASAVLGQNIRHGALEYSQAWLLDCVTGQFELVYP